MATVQPVFSKNQARNALKSALRRANPVLRNWDVSKRASAYYAYYAYGGYPLGQTTKQEGEVILKELNLKIPDTLSDNLKMY